MRRSLLYFLGCILCLLVAKPATAQVANQNFNALTSANSLDVSSASGYVPPGGLTFTCSASDATNYMSVINGTYNTSTFGDYFSIINPASNYAFIFNVNPAGIYGVGPTTFGFHSATSNPFTIVSMLADAGGGLGGATTLTFTGYKNGNPVSGATSVVDMAASGTYNSIVYTNSGNLGGALNFDSSWQNIDEVRITGSDPTVAIDNLVFSPVISPTSLTAATVGTAYSQSVTASGGAGTYTYAVTSGSLPAGLTLSSSTGTISGTPTAGGSFNFTITATDAASSTGAQVYTLTVNAPTITLVPASPLTSGIVATAYSRTITASGGTSTYTFAVTAGALPAGLSLAAATGIISGTPTAGGTFNFTITATDSSTGTGPYTGSQAYTLTINSPLVAISPSTLTAATVGTSYTATVTGSGATAPYTFAITNGALPAGLSLATDGTLSGTPTAGGNFTFRVTATDSSTGTGPYSTSRTYLNFTVNAPTITLAPATLTAAIVGTAYSTTVTASGGTSTYTYAVTAGSLPTGLTLTANGTLSGTPTAGGAFNFTITATDSSTGTGSYTGSQTYAFTVNAPTITLSPEPGGIVGTAYSRTVTSSGGTSPYTYAVTTGTLPTGLSLSAAGALSGTPTAGGTFNFTITSTDSSTGTGPYSSPRAYSLTINAPTIVIAPATLPAATVATAYSQSVTASSGTAPYTYAVTAGALPTGLTLATNGTLSGTPTAGGTFNFTITATDSSTGTGPYTNSRAYSFTVNAPTIAVSPATLPAATSVQNYNQTITASGGTAAYTFAVTAGALPTGITLSISGALTGTATQLGTFNFTVTATDASTGTGPYTNSRAYTLTVNPPALTVNPATISNGTVGTAYSQNITTSRNIGTGTETYTYAITAGALPAGLTFSSGGNGFIGGTPTQDGTFNFTITSTDNLTGAGPYTASRAYTIVIAAPTITINPPQTAVSASSVTPLNYTQTASGGTSPYTFAITSGTLPAGLSMATDGTISGTGTVLGSQTVTVTATDNSTGTGPFTKDIVRTITVSGPILAVSPTTAGALAPAKAGAVYTQTFTAAATGSTAPYTFTKTTGNLPPGLTLATDGTLSGTPTAVGNYLFTIRAVDSSPSPGPYNGSRTYAGFAVSAPTIVVGPATIPDGTAGVAYSQNIIATGGTAPYNYTITAGALPAGITLAANGTLSGTSTVVGSFTFTVNATDATTGAGAPYGGSTSYTVNFAAPTITLTPATLAAASVGTAYSQTVTASGGTTPYTYAITAGTLPSGLTLAASTGAIIGTPTAGGAFNFTVTATDGLSFTGSQAYALTANAATLALAPATLPAGSLGTAYSQSVTVSGGTSPYTYVVSAGALPTGVALATNGTLSGTPTAAGTFNFTVTATDASTGTGPYTASTAYSVIIGKANQTITFADINATYGDAPVTLTGTASSGLGVTYTSSNTSVATITGSTLTILAAGTATITASQAGNANYNAATDLPKTLTVNTKALTITAIGPAKTYGTALTAGTSITYFTAGAAVTGQAVTSVTLTPDAAGLSATTAAGAAYTVTPSAATGTGGFVASNYNITYVPFTGTVGKATLDITANTVNKTYGQTLTGAAGSTAFTATGLQNSETIGSVTLAYGTGAAATAAVNTYTGQVTPSAATGGTFNTANYNIVYHNNDIVVGKANLTITAANKAKIYGDVLTNATGSAEFTAAGLQNSETVGTVNFAYGTGATANAAVGTYTAQITPSNPDGGTFNAGNYTIAYANGNIIVGAKVIAVTADAKTKVYGTADPVLTYQITSGSLVGTDVLTGALTRDAGEAVNTYAIKQGTLGASGNYTITYTGANLTITQATLLAKANNQTKAYGAANPTFTVSYTGFASGDTEASLTTKPRVSTTATASSVVGTYPLTVNGGASPNYAITYSPGTLTVTPAVLTITADNKSRNYGAANPAFTVTYSGFVNGDDATKLTIGAVAVNNSIATTAPGSYPITVSGASAANYTVNYVAGTLTIVPLTNTDLTALAISSGTLSPAFNTNTFAYNVTVDNATANLTLTPTFAITASAAVNGTTVINGSSSFGVPINAGNNVITLTITAQDGITKKTYILNIYRGLDPINITATNILTPNSDGKNDYWIVKDIELYPKNTVTVYDKAGRVVYTKVGYRNEWDGTLNGAPLAQGTYYYTVNLGPYLPSFKGFISIIKNN